MLWLNIDLASCHSQLGCRPLSVTISLSHSLSDTCFHKFTRTVSIFTFLVPLLCFPPFSCLSPAVLGYHYQLVLTCVNNNDYCCFRDAVSVSGGGVSGPGNSDEEPVHRQQHAHSATRGRPCQQVRTSTPQRDTLIYLAQMHTWTWKDDLIRIW